MKDLKLVYDDNNNYLEYYLGKSIVGGPLCYVVNYRNEANRIYFRDEFNELPTYVRDRLMKEMI